MALYKASMTFALLMLSQIEYIIKSLKTLVSISFKCGTQLLVEFVHFAALKNKSILLKSDLGPCDRDDIGGVELFHPNHFGAMSVGIRPFRKHSLEQHRPLVAALTPSPHPI